MRVLIACEFSGVVRDAFTANGHDAWSCDLEPTETPGNHLQCDVSLVLADGWDMLLAFPPCTHLAVSGARFFEQKRRDGRMEQGRNFFMQMIEAPIGKIAVENPIGVMSTLYRKPDQIIHPYHHGHTETKATCLWLWGLELLTPSNLVAPDYVKKADGSYYVGKDGKRFSRVHFMSSKDRAKVRSRTYVGIAKAMADQWGKPLVAAGEAISS